MRPTLAPRNHRCDSQLLITDEDVDKFVAEMLAQIEDQPLPGENTDEGANIYMIEVYVNLQDKEGRKRG